MANTTRAIDWALGQGANAVEVDLRFNLTEPEEFRHGNFFCDCGPTLAGGYCSFASQEGTVCEQLDVDSSSQGVSKCDVSTAVDDLLHHLASKMSQLALVVIVGPKEDWLVYLP